MHAIATFMERARDSFARFAATCTCDGASQRWSHRRGRWECDCCHHPLDDDDGRTAVVSWPEEDSHG